MDSIHNSCWVILPAAGAGRRMETAIPKQYLMLGDQTVIEHTVNIFLGLSAVRKIVVTVSSDDDRWHELPLSRNEIISVAVGGRERFDSVYNGLMSLDKMARRDDWVLIHDAVRPCVRGNDIKRLLNHIANHPIGGLLCTPVSDTLKRIDENHQVITTVDRSHLWQAQTPQVFRYGPLCAAMHQAQEERNFFTDEASVMEFYGYSPLAIRGHKDNIKITHPEDILLAKLILHAHRAMQAKAHRQQRENLW